VPSTPHQKARDPRFHSRSPSPGQGINGHSPKSVASEAIGHHAPPKAGAPTVCKFETGDEIRKRRIPYVDGGHEELGPPKEEPKKTLTPDEREKLSGDMRELYDRLLPSEESEENRRKLIQKLDRILHEEWPDHEIHVNVFGSSGNLLSSTDSDVDICVTTPLKKLVSMHSLATLLHRRKLKEKGDGDMGSL
jgi:DNA polymerase sigma